MDREFNKSNWRFLLGIENARPQLTTPSQLAIMQLKRGWNVGWLPKNKSYYRVLHTGKNELPEQAYPDHVPGSLLRSS